MIKGEGMFRKPGRPGLIVREPRTMTPRVADGDWQSRIGPQGRYWRRRLKCGDVLLCKPPVAEKKEAAKPVAKPMQRKKGD